MPGERRMKRAAYFIPFRGCARRCVYCDQFAITGVSAENVLSPEAVARDMRNCNEPVELCFFGGSFMRLPESEIVAYLDAVRLAPQGSRVTFSSYPGDFLGAQGVRLLCTLGKYPIGTAELGIPSLDAQVLAQCRREDDPDAVLRAVAVLRDGGFHLGVQTMIGLPGQSPESAQRDIAALAAQMPAGAAWHLRIYPCLVMRDTELASLYAKGVYAPLGLEDAVRQAGELLHLAARAGFRPIRTGLLESDSLRRAVVAGPYHPAFGELAASECLIRSLLTQHPTGPWTVEKRHISKLTGHARRGIARIAEMTGLSAATVEGLIHPTASHIHC